MLCCFTFTKVRWVLFKTPCFLPPSYYYLIHFSHRNGPIIFNACRRYSRHRREALGRASASYMRCVCKGSRVSVYRTLPWLWQMIYASSVCYRYHRTIKNHFIWPQIFWEHRRKCRHCTARRFLNQRMIWGSPYKNSISQSQTRFTPFIADSAVQRNDSRTQRMFAFNPTSVREDAWQIQDCLLFFLE